jgi:hypothetical protein
MGTSLNHMPGKDNDNVLYLDLNNQIIQRIPKKLDYFYPNLEIFKCVFCAITDITRDDLRLLPKIQCLYLGHNSIETLPGDLLKDVPNLIFLAVDHNRIHCIGENLFTEIRNLKLLYFNYNDCFDFFDELDVSKITQYIVAQCEMAPCHKTETAEIEELTRKRSIQIHNISRDYEDKESYCDKYYIPWRK